MQDYHCVRPETARAASRAVSRVVIVCRTTTASGPGPPALLARVLAGLLLAGCQYLSRAASRVPG
jgi:hypothetical protein